MNVKRLASALILPVLLALAIGACNALPAVSQAESERVALEFVESEGTYRFDGLPGTLEVTGTSPVSDGWTFTVEFDSAHAGFGDRTGQMLAQVITHHSAAVTVRDGRVTAAVMDMVWDMVNHRTAGQVDIKQAPIHEVKVFFMKSNPPQVGVHIQGGLSDGCTTFHDAVVLIEGNLINIFVTTQRPHDVSCPAIYTNFEQDINLGSGFAFGTTYTLKVNDFTTTFTYQ
jgi:hypothetical protein